MNKDQFFNYHANAGGKLLTCYIGGKLYDLTKREFNKLQRNTTLELPCGTLYKIAD